MILAQDQRDKGRRLSKAYRLTSLCKVSTDEQPCRVRTVRLVREVCLHTCIHVGYRQLGLCVQVVYKFATMLGAHSWACACEWCLQICNNVGYLQLGWKYMQSDYKYVAMLPANCYVSLRSVSTVVILCWADSYAIMPFARTSVCLWQLQHVEEVVPMSLWFSSIEPRYIP